MEDNRQNFNISTTQNLTHVVYRDGLIELRSRDKSLQSVIDPAQPGRLCMTNLEYMAALLLFIVPPERALLLGTSAGGLLHFLRHHYPDCQLTALDIDQDLIQQLQQREILPPADERLDYVFADARHYLTECRECFDLIMVDIFSGAHTPAWLLQKSSIEALYRCTAEGGGVAWNLLVDSEHDFRRFYQDLRQPFNGHTLSLPVPELDNRIIHAVRDGAPIRDMGENMEIAQRLSARLDLDLMPVLATMYNTNPAGASLV